MSFSTHARGKLLLTGEYFVLDGALALALPVRFGQSLLVEPWKQANRLSWSSRSVEGQVWFLAEFEMPDLAILNATDKKTAHMLQRILHACQLQNPEFLSGGQGLKAMTQNDFPREWGLGTSSTLIAAVARWAGVDPYPVLFSTLGGSGYDIACAYAQKPLLYRLEGQTPQVQEVDFRPSFSDQLYFVFLGKKQDSREGIRRYREQAQGKQALLEEVSGLTRAALEAKSLVEFERILREHEQLVSRTLDLPRARDLYFSDFPGEIKSLGAWGGDFVIATSDAGEEATRRYFLDRGFNVVMSWAEMGIF